MLYKVSLLFLFMQSTLSFNKIFLLKIKTLETNKQLKIKNIHLFVQPNNNFDNIDNPDSTNEVNLTGDENIIDPNSNSNLNPNSNLNSEKKNKFYHFNIFPRLEEPNENGLLTWYPIGFGKDFSIRPKRITIRDINYVVWKDKNRYYGLRDSCSHQGSSFQFGNSCKNTITCPYHGYVFDGTNGELIEIPKLQYTRSNTHNVECFKVVERGDIVYLNTIPITNEETKNKIDESLIFIEPEYFDPDQRVVNLYEDFEHYAKFVSVNSLDICHIGFVHTFGNRKNPNPIHNSKIVKLNDTNFHYKITYEYFAGEKSLVNKIYNYNKIVVENEYVLPHSTVARVIFGDFTSTIVTHALPVSKFKTKLFVKAYRSYWSFDLDNFEKNYPIFYPFFLLVNKLGDIVTKKTMITTLKQDKSIIDFIDKTSYKLMHGNFSIVYDKFANHYKNNYKKFYENGPFTI
jgi:phenylpropionate dioxygenase-like ring-hydroxylating dioxygenase large terminal subunit